MQKTLVVQLIQRFPILFDLLLKIAPYRGSLAPQLRVNNYIFHRNAYLFRLHAQLKGIIVNFDLTLVINYCDCWACFCRASFSRASFSRASFSRASFSRASFSRASYAEWNML